MKYESIVEKIQQLKPVVGAKISDKFEDQIALATQQLAEELKASSMEDNAKIRYAGYMFSKALSDLVDMLEPPQTLN